MITLCFVEIAASLRRSSTSTGVAQARSRLVSQSIGICSKLLLALSFCSGVWGVGRVGVGGLCGKVVAGGSAVRNEPLGIMKSPV